MYIDHERAIIVFDTLVNALRENSFPYNSSDTPQVIVGKRLSKYSPVQRARFWFYLCMYMRGPVKSNYAAQKLLEIFEAQKGGGIFNPHSKYSRNPECIDVVMTRHNFTRLLASVKKFWAQASEKLLSEYSGDPRRVFQSIKSFEEIEQRVRYKPKTGDGFMGFQKKMSSMLAYFLRDQGLIDLHDFPPPVDFHLMRIMVLTQVIVLKDEDPRKFRYETSHLLGFEAIDVYRKTTGADPIELGDALWLLSGNLCNLSPKNAEKKAFGIFCSETINNTVVSKRKRLAAHPGLFDHHGVDLPLGVSIPALRKTCGRCPAKDFCKGGLPAVEYYNYGLLEYREGI